MKSLVKIISSTVLTSSTDEGETQRLRKYSEVENFRDELGNVIIGHDSLRRVTNRHPEIFVHPRGWTIEEAVRLYLETGFKKTEMFRLVRSFSRQNSGLQEYINGIRGARELRGLRDVHCLSDFKDDNGNQPYEEEVLRKIMQKRRDIFVDVPFFSLAQLLRYCWDGTLKSNKARLIKGIINYDHPDSSRIIWNVLSDIPTIQRLAADRDFVGSLDPNELAGLYVALALNQIGIKNILSPGYDPLAENPMRDYLEPILLFVRGRESVNFSERLAEYASSDSLKQMIGNSSQQIHPMAGQLWYNDLLSGLNSVPISLKRIFSRRLEQIARNGRVRHIPFGAESVTYRIAEILVLSQFPIACKSQVQSSLESINPHYLSRGGDLVYRLASYYFLPKT